MQENKFQRSDIQREGVEPLAKGSNSSVSEDRDEDMNGTVYQNENSRLTRRYSFDDNGGGYLGL